VEGRDIESLLVKNLLLHAAKHHPRPASEPDQQLNICVISTSPEATTAALKKAGVLADSLNARISLMVPQVVPFPLPLESPPVLVEFNENRYRAIASEVSVETSVHIYLCRDRLQTLISVLPPGALIVLGGCRRWWPTNERRLARRLRKIGHEVILIETE